MEASEINVLLTGIRENSKERRTYVHRIIVQILKWELLQKKNINLGRWVISFSMFDWLTSSVMSFHLRNFY